MLMFAMRPMVAAHQAANACILSIMEMRSPGG